MIFSVERDDTDHIRQVVVDHHYLHRWPDARSLPFAYRLLVGDSDTAPDGLPWGVVVFKKPQHHKQRGLFGYTGLPTAWQVLDMARVWVHPLLQRKEGGHSLCVFSRMVSQCLRRVQADWLIHHPPRFPDQPYHVEVVISYCDLDHHDGTAYRACSFTWGGYSADCTKELYYRKLRTPRKSWQPHRPFQRPLPLFGMPLIHGDGK